MFKDSFNEDEDKVQMKFDVTYILKLVHQINIKLDVNESKFEGESRNFGL